MYEEIRQKLMSFPEFRERRFRERYLCKLALRNCGCEEKFLKSILTLDELADFAHTFMSYDRIWRLVLKENPELRGQDYGLEDGTKAILEEQKMLKLGYEPGFSDHPGFSI